MYFKDILCEFKGKNESYYLIIAYFQSKTNSIVRRIDNYDIVKTNTLVDDFKWNPMLISNTFDFRTTFTKLNNIPYIKLNDIELTIEYRDVHNSIIGTDFIAYYRRYYRHCT